MTIQKVEDSIIGNRQFMEAIVKDLHAYFGYKGYKVTETLAAIQRKEGNVDVITYLQRKYLS